MIDRLFGAYHLRARTDRLAGAQIANPAWMGAARHLQPEAVPSLKPLRRRPHVHFDPQAAVWLWFTLARPDSEQPVTGACFHLYYAHGATTLSTPASGTPVIAEASSVRARRSSGSKL